MLVTYRITRFMDQLCSCRLTVARRELLEEPDLLSPGTSVNLRYFSGFNLLHLICLVACGPLFIVLSIVVSVRRFSTYDYHFGISILLNFLHKSNFSFLFSSLWTIVCLSNHCFVCDCDRTVVAFISACLA